ANAAHHPNLTEAHMLALIESAQPWSARALSMTNRESILEHYAQSPDPYVRGIVAFNASTSTALAESLAKDLHSSVRLNAAFCPQLPRATRAFLAHHDPDPWVRREIVAAMTNREMRAILEGCRLVDWHTEGSPAGITQEVWLLGFPTSADADFS
ncbi:MAG: hypothetical protein PHU75_09980, partial [Candidatus Nanopelagicales bacterium]|nr:hypothetical protein [Candidatus Nanopelagicales bacterium]